MTRSPITVAIEGDADLAVVEALLRTVNRGMGRAYGFRGKGWLDKQLPAYNRAAQFTPWFVLRDFDKDDRCAAEVVSALVPGRISTLCLRLAVRSIEAWLLADSERIAAFLSVSKGLVPREPDRLGDPKATLVALARRSKRRLIREDVVPAKGTTARVGPGYTSQVTEYVATAWRPRVAARHSPSLSRCLSALTILP